ncbi:AraC family ligand binding domain-containing protein [Raoultibacter massiliensis]|uniref:AraC family ligand binding domain-containing protein n=1 Tax=Raoultibacter massiliensis TaxID=1852371 RepID=UPI003A907831
MLPLEKANILSFPPPSERGSSSDFYAESKVIGEEMSLVSKDCLEIYLFLGGRGSLVVDGFERELKSGTLCFLTPFDIYTIRPQQGSPLAAYHAEFPYSATMGLLADPTISSATFRILDEQKGCALLPPLEFARAVRAFEDLVSLEKSKSGMFFRHYVKSLRTLVFSSFTPDNWVNIRTASEGE